MKKIEGNQFLKFNRIQFNQLKINKISQFKVTFKVQQKI